MPYLITYLYFGAVFGVVSALSLPRKYRPRVWVLLLASLVWPYAFYFLYKEMLRLERERQR